MIYRQMEGDIHVALRQIYLATTAIPKEPTRIPVIASVLYEAISCF